MLNTFARFRITLTDAVKYVTNVESYDRRIQWAISIQSRKMQRRAEFFPTSALRRAGWKQAKASGQRRHSFCFLRLWADTPPAYAFTFRWPVLLN